MTDKEGQVRRILVVAAVAVILGACGGGSESADDDLLYLDSGEELAAVQALTGQVAFRVPGAVTTPNFSRAFRAGGDGDASTLEALDTTSGTVTWSRPVEPGLEPRIAAPDESVVLMPRRSETTSSPYRPEGRARTSMTIVRPGGAEPQRLDLAGNYEPEAFSTDGQALFLIEYRPPTQPEVYSVRQLELATGEISPVPSPDKELQEDMRGTARTQAMAPDGTRLYTLYTLELPHPDGAVDRHAFVHVLDLRERWAHCVDLPTAFATTSETAAALAVSPDSGTVYVANRKAGRMAEIDATGPSLRRTVPVDLAPDERLSATAHDGGVLVGTGHRVLDVDADLRVRQTWQLAQTVAGLQPSEDGSRIYVGQSGRVVILDPGSPGQSVIPIAVPGTLRSVGRSQGALAAKPALSCAC